MQGEKKSIIQKSLQHLSILSHWDNHFGRSLLCWMMGIMHISLRIRGASMEFELCFAPHPSKAAALLSLATTQDLALDLLSQVLTAPAIVSSSLLAAYKSGTKGDI